MNYALFTFGIALALSAVFMEFRTTPLAEKYYHVRYTAKFDGGSVGSFSIDMNIKNPPKDAALLRLIEAECMKVLKRDGTPAQWVIIDNLISP